MRCGALCALGLFALACGASLPAPYTQARDAASAAYSAGAYQRSAELWQRAERLAPNARERDEAAYRRASALERAGDRAGADAAYAAIAQSNSERAERAAFARADLALTTDDSAAGYVLLEHAIARFPNSGLAQRGCQRLLNHAREVSGSDGEGAELRTLLAATRNSEVADYLELQRARWLSDRGELEAAHTNALALARAHPYPNGVYWDEALAFAAELDLKAARVDEALAHLNELLSVHETASLLGSYERVTFAQARFRVAEIYRDRLNELARARAEFDRVYADHPTSSLRDDALFESALLDLRLHDEATACLSAQRLRTEQPDSHFSRCAQQLCPALAVAKDSCRAALSQRIAEARSAR